MNLTPDLPRFVTKVPIRFAHCDPAGIIFFPQYLVLFNGLVEDWFNQGLQIPYADMVAVDKIGLPIVHLECDFRAITRMGEVVDFVLSVSKLGTRSITLQLECVGADGVLRVACEKVLVFTSLVTHQATAVPPHIRAAIERFMQTQ